MEMKYEFLKVNVFTKTKDGGNPLPVMLDARGLSEEEKQHIALGFGYSETAFIEPPENPSHTAKVDIFTPERRLPFAGHPNVGAAYVVGSQATVIGNPVGGPILFEEGVGIVEARLIKEKRKVIGARVKAPKALHVSDEKINPVILAECMSLNAGQVVTGNHQPVFADVGLQFLFAELENLRALQATRIDPEAYERINQRYPQEDGRFSIFVYVRDGEGYENIFARMHSNDRREDPATGSACAAMSALLAHHDPRRDFSTKIKIEQGPKRDQLSQIYLEVKKAKGIVESVWFGGQCVSVERGTIERTGQILRSCCV